MSFAHSLTFFMRNNIKTTNFSPRISNKSINFVAAMKQSVSILIPVYNGTCTDLVRHLVRQAESIENLSYEIIVADDGSTNESVVTVNRDIVALPHCRYIIRGENVGRAAIRNFLANEAQYEWLLFIDCDMTVHNDDFLKRYLAEDDTQSADVVDGGVTIGGDEQLLKGNLRFLYEKHAESEHTAAMRQKQPYHHLHTANLLMRRRVMEECPFDERFRHYGYEDVLLGKQLKAKGFTISHIDNPLGFDTFESNSAFVAKTEEALRTLNTFRNELRGYSGLLTVADGIHLPLVRTLLVAVFCLCKPLVRRNLCSSHPLLPLFKPYKLGYFLKLKRQ